MLIFSDN